MYSISWLRERTKVVTKQLGATYRFQLIFWKQSKQISFTETHSAKWCTAKTRWLFRDHKHLISWVKGNNASMRPAFKSRGGSKREGYWLYSCTCTCICTLTFVWRISEECRRNWDHNYSPKSDQSGQPANNPSESSWQNGWHFGINAFKQKVVEMIVRLDDHCMYCILYCIYCIFQHASPCRPV